LRVEARIVHANIDELQTCFGEPALGKSQLRPEDCSIFCYKAELGKYDLSILGGKDVRG
jgi:hypothetical protein